MTAASSYLRLQIARPYFASDRQWQFSESGLRWRAKTAKATYFLPHQTRHLLDAPNHARLLQMLSPQLQADTVLAVNRSWLRKV